MADVGTSILAATQGFSAWFQFMPRLSEVRRGNDADTVADVRVGELASSAVTIGTGALISSLTGSNAPILISLIVCIGLTILYECTLRGNGMRFANGVAAAS